MRLVVGQDFKEQRGKASDLVEVFKMSGIIQLSIQVLKKGHSVEVFLESFDEFWLDYFFCTQDWLEKVHELETDWSQ